MRGLRVAAGVIAGLGVLASLTACSDDPAAERDEAEQVQARALAAVDGVVHEVAESNHLDFISGSRSFVICGERYAPGGVISRVSVNLGQSDESAEAMVEVAATALEADGWTVERVTNTAIIEGTKDENTLRFHFGGAGTKVTIKSSCVETSKDVANDYGDEGYTDLAWK